MIKTRLKYEGPIKGKIRFWLHRREIRALYREMIEDLNDRLNSGYTFDEALDETNRAFENNEFGMYLYTNETRIRNLMLSFAFVDCEMRDNGYVEVSVY